MRSRSGGGSLAILSQLLSGVPIGADDDDAAKSESEGRPCQTFTFVV